LRQEVRSWSRKRAERTTGLQAAGVGCRQLPLRGRWPMAMPSCAGSCWSWAAEATLWLSAIACAVAAPAGGEREANLRCIARRIEGAAAAAQTAGLRSMPGESRCGGPTRMAMTSSSTAGERRDWAHPQLWWTPTPGMPGLEADTSLGSGRVIRVLGG